MSRTRYCISLKNHTINGCLLFLFVLIAYFESYSQGSWELKKDKDHIQVYILEDDSAEFNPYKSIAIIDGDIHDMERLLKDSPNMPKWSESVVKVKVLEEIGDSIQIYYSVADAPFPIKNRDGIYRNIFSWSEDGKVLTIDVKLLPHFIEKNEDCERVSGWGYWRIEDIDNGKMEVVCEMHIHPGGNIPAWLVNTFVDENPYKNMIGIKEILKQLD